MPIRTRTRQPSRRRSGPAEVRTTEKLQPDTLPHFEKFCGRLRLDNGQPFVLEPFQRQILKDYFDGVRETLVLLPSGNGKTTLFAALALYHLLITAEPEVFIMAASRDQAGRMHEHIKGFINRSPGLKKRVSYTRRRCDLVERKGFIEVLASDEDTVDGIGPTLALIDELHRHKTTGLYVVALKGLKKRRGRMLHCTTAGETEQSPLGELRKRGHKLPGLRRQCKHTYGRSKNRTFAIHEWALNADDDRHDMAVVKQANPLSTITEADLAAEHEAMKWWEWCRFACGLWVAGEHSAISPLDWAECANKKLRFKSGLGQILTIDLAWVRDCTAIDAVQAVSHTDIRTLKIATIEPPGDGTAIREEAILKPIREWVKANPTCKAVVLDPEAGGRSLVEKLEDLDLVVIQHSQKNEPMADAARIFDEIIRNRYLAHGDDPEVTGHVLAAAAKTLSAGWKLVKRRKNPEWIDHCIALAMGVRVALAELDAPEPPDVSAYSIGTLG